MRVILARKHTLAVIETLHVMRSTNQVYLITILLYNHSFAALP